jgi:ribose transport system permease protein
MNQTPKQETATAAPPGASGSAKILSDHAVAGVHSEVSTDGSRRRYTLGFDRFSGLYVLAVIILVFGVWVPDTFLTTQTLKTVASQQAVVAVLALALLPPLAAGIFDLSVGAMLGLAVVLVTKFQSAGLDFPLAIVLTLAVGAAVGAVNSFLIIFFRVDSFIATLGTSSILGAMVYWVSGNQQIVAGISPDFVRLGQGSFVGIPLPFIYLLIVAAILLFVMEFRPLGRQLYATGGNEVSARLSGVRTDRMMAISLLFSGTIAALGGVIFAAIIGSGSLTAGPPFLLPAFAAVFLGSTQIKNGRANVLGTIIAVYVLGLGVKGLLLVGAEFWVSDLFNGVTLVAAVALAVRRGQRTS